VQRAIVWQDRRTAERCRALPADLLRARTGLLPDPYFSATKLEWILERADLPQRELAFGTVDTWLVWRLTGGAEHVTDVTNASRTLLYGLDAGDWDDDLLRVGVERGSPARRAVERASRRGRPPAASVPIAGSRAISRPPLGQGCVAAGPRRRRMTGSFVLVNTGSERGDAPAGLLERRLPSRRRRRRSSRSRAPCSSPARRSSGSATASA
jgi:glycerol kinase